MTYLIGSIIAFSILILIHEGGHFLVAKAVGIKVNEFSLGMGPKIFGFQKGETLYCLRAIPIGGFIKPEGEDAESQDPRAFGNRPLWARAAVVAAGPISNFLLAFGILILLFIIAGRPAILVGNINPYVQVYDTNLRSGDPITKINGKNTFDFQKVYDETTILNNKPNINFTVYRNGKEEEVLVNNIYSNVLNKYVLPIQPIKVGALAKGESAEKSDLKVNDIIIKVNNVKIVVFEELIKLVDSSPDSKVTLTVLRDGIEKDITISTRYSQELKRNVIGIVPGIDVVSKPVRLSVKKDYEASMDYSKYLIDQTAQGITRLVKLQITKDEMAGPVGIVGIIGQVAKQGPYDFTVLVAILSLSLGVFNLFPIPALDGGRLVFFAIEGIRRKPINQKKEATVHFIGFVLLILLVIFITFNDIKRIFVAM